MGLVLGVFVFIDFLANLDNWEFTALFNLYVVGILSQLISWKGLEPIV